MTDYGALATEMNEADNNASSSSNDSDDEYDNDSPIVNVVPTTAIEFDEITDVGLMGGIRDEQNIRTSGRDSNDAVITVSNPSVGEGTLFAATNGHSADYKLVNEDHDRVEVDYDSSGNATGIRTYGRKFESEEVDDFEEDEIRLMVGSAAGLRLLQVLDCNGASAAYINEDGNKVDGLVEYPSNYNADDYNPSEDDKYQRIAVGPELRSDLVGEDGVLFFYLSDQQYSDNYQHRVTVFDTADDPTPSNAVEPTDEGEHQEYSPWLVWDDFDGDDGTDGSSDDTDDLSMDFDEGTTYSELDETSQMFVDDMADKIDNENKSVSDFDFHKVVPKAEQANDITIDEDPDVLADIIDARS